MHVSFQFNKNVNPCSLCHVSQV